MRCVSPFPAYEAGNIAIFYLYDSMNLISLISDYSNTVIFAQIHGHIQINDRWLKSNDKFANTFVDSEELRPSVDQIQALPTDPRSDRIITNSTCIFASSKVPVSPLQLFESGVYLEVKLPSDLLSSFKSRSMNVDYYISINVQSLTYQKTFHFPITIHSPGTTQIPYYTKYSFII